MDRKYVEDNSKTLIPSFLGMKVCEVLEDNFGLVVSSELTAELEEKLDKIASGQPVYEESLNEFWTYLKKQVAEKEPNIKENIDKYRGVQPEVADPKTGDFMVLKFGKFGEYYQKITRTVFKTRKRCRRHILQRNTTQRNPRRRHYHDLY